MSKPNFDTSQNIMTPKEIVRELNTFIVGQHEAKRAVAIALRNRWRRMQLPCDLQKEVTPKNILMIGPTGIGKTEIARRLAKLAKAPFIKVEATKFTEVGYVGRDVDSIIRDLVDVSVKIKREESLLNVKQKANENAENKIIEILVPSPKADETETKDNSATKQKMLQKLRDGELDQQEIEIDITSIPLVGVEIMAPPGMEDMTNQLSHLFQNLSSERRKKRNLLIKDALRLLREEESSKLIDDENIKTNALKSVEQNGIVFLDEIDKIARRSEKNIGGDVSREGVQRDLLPLIEGCTVSTRYGMIKTDHILFIASGAFHTASPSDLIPELQGRLPIRVELKSLTADDFVRILTEPKASLTKQYIALLETENVKINFTKDGVQRIAEIAYQVNEQHENIGARRLYTVMERLLETISFEASDQKDTKIAINKKYVNDHLNELLEDEDLSKYIL